MADLPLPRTGPAAFIGGVTAFHVVDHRLVPERWHLLSHSLAGPVAVLAAAALGATPRVMGLEPEHARAGLITGSRHAAVSAAIIGAGLLLPVAAEALEDPRVAELGPDELARRILLEIPLSTVLYEELVFRGALLGLLLTRLPEGAAVAVSSALFGLWHVLPALEDRRHNQLVGQLPLLVTVLPTVAGTTVAGALFARLRLRTGSVLAPMLVHTAVNATGLLGGALVARWRNRHRPDRTHEEDDDGARPPG